MFGIFKTYRDIKKGIKDPSALGQELALDVVRAPLVLFTIIGVLFVALMFVLGFTSIFSHPHLFFKIIFWLGLIPFVILEIVAWSLFSAFKKIVTTAKKKVSEKIIDVTPE